MRIDPTLPRWPGGSTPGASASALATIPPVSDSASNATRARLEAEARDLEPKVQRLRSDLAEAQTSLRDANQLKAIRQLHQENYFPTATQPVTARVIAKSPGAISSAVIAPRELAMTTASRLENYPTLKARLVSHQEETRQQDEQSAPDSAGDVQNRA